MWAWENMVLPENVSQIPFMKKDKDITCCICHQRLDPPYNLLGGRAYCDHHYAVVNRPHPSFWRAALLQLLGMALLAGLVAWLAETFVGPLAGMPLLVASLLLAIVPSALWLIFFYQQDRLEPEPTQKVAAVFLLAALLTDVLGRRIVYDWYQVNLWAPTDTLTSLLASILIIAVAAQLIIYVAMRVLVYDSPEFDERMDGIIYGTVAGLGVATVTNLHFVLGSGGVALGPGVIQTVTTALAQASFGGLQGWFMAEARFEHKPVWWVPLGFLIAVVSNGVFSWLIGEVSATGLQVEAWRSLLFGMLVAIFAFLLLAGLMQRSHAVTLRR
ncbi:MAG: PrsW family intramembrane metalloprotease [Candidatus Viridilinea halotolerans]|uniref:PrsW family intramembrane metalloprotease n=1 Tax=Candidatus Viridilinea halotolerans TaxID=2491704 RepID=A0A426TZ59_9CHLR|nr:MAG: PrsW family intramembrane metalloprotease [Candidatus Viridilinea halotolerans]